MAEWKRRLFLETSSRFEGAPALFMEKPTVTLVRVSGIEADSWGVRIKFVCVPTTGISLLSHDRTEVTVTAAWMVFSPGYMWKADYVGWELWFDASLLADIRREAALAGREGKTLEYEHARHITNLHLEKQSRSRSLP